MIASPTVTVAMPAYNAERTIGEAIRSVLAQTRQDFELVICDDASTDDTIAVARKFTDPRIRLVVNDSNLGIDRNRDRAVAMARGHWVTVLDDDDVIQPDRIEKLLAVAEAHPNSVVFDEVMACHDTKQGLVPWKPIRNPKRFYGPSREPGMVSITSWVSEPRRLVKPLFPTSLVREHAITHAPAGIAGDVWFVLLFLALTRAELWYVPETLYFWRMRSVSGSTASNRNSITAQALEKSAQLFDWSKEIQQTIEKQAAIARKSETYQHFFSALMHRHFYVATFMAVRNPWVLPEFARRSFERSLYHASRLRHGGARRKTS